MSVQVLECCAGEGRLYRGCWHSFSGACLDKKVEAVSVAASVRPGWRCYQGDTERALIGGFMRHIPFDVVDIDTYGSPWPILRAWMTSERERAEITHVFLTDGYMRHRSVSSACRALFQERHGVKGVISLEMYRKAVAARLAEWSLVAEVTASMVETVVSRKMSLHYLLVSRSSCPEARRPGGGACQTSGIA